MLIDCLVAVIAVVTVNLPSDVVARTTFQGPLLCALFSLRLQSGGLNVFMQTFLAEARAVLRAHVLALGGNALVAYQLNELFLLDNPHKHQVNELFLLDNPHKYQVNELFLLDNPHKHQVNELFLLDNPHKYQVNELFLLDNPHKHQVNELFLLDNPHKDQVNELFLLDNPHKHQVNELFLLDNPHKHQVSAPRAQAPGEQSGKPGTRLESLGRGCIRRVLLVPCVRGSVPVATKPDTPESGIREETETEFPSRSVNSSGAHTNIRD